MESFTSDDSPDHPTLSAMNNRAKSTIKSSMHTRAAPFFCSVADAQLKTRPTPEGDTEFDTNDATKEAGRAAKQPTLCRSLTNSLIVNAQ